MNSNENIELLSINEAIINFTNALYDQECFDLLKKEEIRDILSAGQLRSKIWLLKHLKSVLNQEFQSSSVKIVVAGGWVGILARALHHLDERIIADSIDIDPNATIVAKLTLDKISGQAITQDMYLLNYNNYDCVINTSAEHIQNVNEWSSLIPKNKLVVVQSNNGKNIPGHVSCVDSSDELSSLLNLSKIYYSGEMVFSNYTRYMVIGKK